MKNPYIDLADPEGMSAPNPLLALFDAPDVLVHRTFPGHGHDNRYSRAE